MSLYEAAMAKFDSPASWGAFYSDNPNLLRELVITSLQAEGIELGDSSTLVDWVIEKQTVEVLCGLKQLDQDALEHRPRGRRRNSITHNLILTSTSRSFLAKGVNKRVARKAAAQRLGGSITAEKVAKAENAYARDFSCVSRAAGRKLLDEAARLVLSMERDLDEIEAGLCEDAAREEADRKKRRYCSPIGGCFGARPDSIKAPSN